MQWDNNFFLGVATIIVSLYGVWLGYRQKLIEARHEKEAKHVDSNARLIDQLQKEVERLGNDLEDARKEIRMVYAQFGSLRSRLIDVEIGAKILSSQVIEMNGIPRWTMPPGFVESVPSLKALMAQDLPEGPPEES